MYYFIQRPYRAILPLREVEFYTVSHRRHLFYPLLALDNSATPIYKKEKQRGLWLLAVFFIGCMLVFYEINNNYCAADCPAMRPNTIKSARAFPPSRFPPWTPPVTSPAANNPGIGSPFSSNTCAEVLIKTPPMV